MIFYNHTLCYSGSLATVRKMGIFLGDPWHHFWERTNENKIWNFPLFMVTSEESHLNLWPDENLNPGLKVETSPQNSGFSTKNKLCQLCPYSQDAECRGERSIKWSSPPQDGTWCHNFHRNEATKTQSGSWIRNRKQGDKINAGNRSFLK